jgi:glycosyltransferase involved in cell wall biosynthesis
MTETVTILVATYGDQTWIDLADQRAIPSAEKQMVPVIHRHGATLHEARNACLHAANTQWVVHLDADDELELGYVETLLSGSADVRAPAVRYVQGQHHQQPRMPNVWGHAHACSGPCLPYGNWIVVGALARRDLLIQLGGWRDFSWSEDWDLWLRCHLSGASIEAIPQAVYRAHMRPHSRNQQPPSARLEAHRAIARANGVPIP